MGREKNDIQYEMGYQNITVYLIENQSYYYPDIAIVPQNTASLSVPPWRIGFHITRR